LKPLILVVDDNKDILFNIKLLLEANDYQVATAKSGKEALKFLNKLEEKPPDIIISDIMMPEMDGYNFFEKISDNAQWNRIPFIFLSARSKPEDIRLGKMLGVDDYLTKPFKEEDLLAIISGKVFRKQKNDAVNKKVEDLLLTVQLEIQPSISDEEEKSLVVLLIIVWDDVIGPEIKYQYPRDIELPFSVKKIGQQLFHAAVSIYGQENITSAEGILLNVDNIKSSGYIFFDSYPDDTVRGNERQYMLTTIAPKINYLESLRIKEIFKDLSKLIKEKKEFDIKNYREKISNILTSPSL